MIDDDKDSGLTDVSENTAPGFTDGKIKTMTPEEYRNAVIERNADEAVEQDDEDDLSDLEEIEDLP